VDLIEDFVRQHRADVAPGVETALKVYDLNGFLARVFDRVASDVRGATVGFNLPFDLSRLAFGVGEGRKAFAGGFSMKLFSYEKDGELFVDPYRPRVGINNIDSKRALLGLTAGWAGEQDADREAKVDEEPKGQLYGPLLDLRTLAFALTNESHSLETACKAFGIPYTKRPVELGVVSTESLSYCREDVAATAALYGKLLAEYSRHPIDLPPARAYSPASIGKAYLRAMGVRPRLRQQPDFPSERLGQAMVAYYGGRAECRIRKRAVPVAYVDFLSMYPTVCTLMGLWQLLTCEQIEVNDATDEVTELLATVTLDDCFDREWWRQLVCLVRVQPDGDLLPVRAKYADHATWQIGLNPLQSREPLWYTLADCVASTLLAGRPPRVVEAIRVTPSANRMTTLQQTALRSSVTVDPREPDADFFRTLIEQRRQLDQHVELPEEERDLLDEFLKVLANSTSYGIFVELNQRHRKRRLKETLYGLAGEFQARVQHPERPGEFAFPPIAAAIAGAARLMLALLERLVRDSGGSYAFCDTDSMAIVSTPEQILISCPGGGCRTEQGEEAVRTLSFADVEAIRRRFRSLNPYDLKLVDESILELEDENFRSETKGPQQLYCYAISAKRYVLFNYDDGVPTIRKYSEHGLGHLLNPVDPEAGKNWILNVWQQLLAQHLAIEYPAPAWLDRPAIGRITVSTPELLKPFESLNDGKPYDEWVKPFNFLLTAHVAPFGHPAGADPAHFQLIGPWERDPTQWLDLAWIDRYTGRRLRIRTTDDWADFDGIANVKNMAQVLADYSVRREPKSAGPDGRPCQRDTIGLLQRRPVVACTITHIGKEANNLDEIEAQLIHDPDDAISDYPDDRRAPWKSLVLPVLRQIPTHEIEKATGLNRSTIKRHKSGQTKPHIATRAKLTRVAANFARRELEQSGFRPPPGDLAALCAYGSTLRPRCGERVPASTIRRPFANLDDDPLGD
jgi:hypothetical protein